MLRQHVSLGVHLVMPLSKIGYAWCVEWWAVGGMIRERDTHGGIGKSRVMFWRWSWRRRGCGIIRATSELTVVFVLSGAKLTMQLCAPFDSESNRW